MPTRRCVVCVAVAAVIGFGSTTTPGATYYVSQSAGNDGWSGLAQAPAGQAGPWKTLARASGEYRPGDRILLRCGDT